MPAGFPGRPNEPFFFGRGGKRMSAEDIALERRLAAQQMAQGTDFSPVGHWTQGAARALTGGLGALRMRGADKASEANAEESNAVLQALVAGGDAAQGAPDPVVAALANPNVSEQVRDLATMMYRERNEAPPAPYRIEDNAGNVQELQPDGSFKPIFIDRALRQFLQDGQLVTVPNPYMGGAAPSGPPPEAVQELRTNPALAPQFDEVFGPGAAARLLSPTIENTPAPELGPNGMPTVLTRQQYQAIVAAKGLAATEDWARRNNVTVSGN